MWHFVSPEGEGGREARRVREAVKQRVRQMARGEEGRPDNTLRTRGRKGGRRGPGDNRVEDLFHILSIWWRRSRGRDAGPGEDSHWQLFKRVGCPLSIYRVTVW